MAALTCSGKDLADRPYDLHYETAPEERGFFGCKFPISSALPLSRLETSSAGVAVASRLVQPLGVAARIFAAGDVKGPDEAGDEWVRSG